MKVKHVCIFALITSLYACNTSNSEVTENVVPEHAQNIEDGDIKHNEKPSEIKTDEKREGIFSYYVGSFEAKKMDDTKSPMLQNKINIALDSMANGVLFGHSVVAGNIRTFRGPVVVKDNNYLAECKEPGDNKYDGVFTFTLNTNDETLRGMWTSNDKKLAVSERFYNLKKTDFKYDPSLALESTYGEVYNSYNAKTEEHEQITDDAGKINASQTELSKKDVENMYKRDLEIMRNAIYARHGYSFKNRKMRYFFDTQVPWYIPVSTDITDGLTELETKNIELIKRYEKHAESYYDVYGR
ncbi:MAG: YARHG domain-containing protein [Bacteroidota bacterium]